MWTENERLAVFRALDIRYPAESVWLKAYLALRIRWGVGNREIAGLRWSTLRAVVGECGDGQDRAWWWRALEEWRTETALRGERQKGWDLVARRLVRGVWRQGGLPCVVESHRKVRPVLEQWVAGWNERSFGKWSTEWRDVGAIYRRMVKNVAHEEYAQVAKEVHRARNPPSPKGHAVNWDRVRAWWEENHPGEPLPKHMRDPREIENEQITKQYHRRLNKALSQMRSAPLS